VCKQLLQKSDHQLLGFFEFCNFFLCAEIEFFVLTGSFFFLSGGELCAGSLELTWSKTSHYGT
jgi:hypothetical protein